MLTAQSGQLQWTGVTFALASLRLMLTTLTSQTGAAPDLESTLRYPQSLSGSLSA